LSDFNQTSILSTSFREKKIIKNVKFHENPTSGS